MNTPPSIPPPKARAWLRAEMEGWVREGLVTPEAARILTERHQLDAPGRGAGQLLAGVLLGIGGLLIGGGVMAMVAANWQEIPAMGKIAGLFILLLGLHGAAFRMLTTGRERLGHGLLLAACVVFGGGIGLMAQVFHISSSTGMAWLMWSAGALASAWAAGSTPSGLLALGLAAFWYLWNGHEKSHYPEWAVAVAPFALLALFGGLARERGSRLLAGGTAVAFMASLSVACAELGSRDSAVAAGMVSGGFLLWAAADWSGPRLAGLVRVMGVGGMAVAAYMASFHGMHRHDSLFNRNELGALGLSALTVIAALALLAFSWLKTPPQPARRRVSWFVLGGAAGVALSYLSSAAYGSSVAVIATALGNLAALLFAAGALASGFSEARRGNFWAGTFLAVAVVLTRFLEYDTDLMLKAMGFIACGVLVMYAGIEYERWLKRRPADAPAEEAGDDLA